METLLANLEDRTVTGLLLPYGEQSRSSNVGPVMFTRGTVALPTDPSIVTLNLKHNREDPVGRAVLLEDTDAGVLATFAIANVPDGDKLLGDVKAGKLSRLSAEVKGLIRDAKDSTRAVAGALFGAAAVDEGAFASATLYAELAEDTTAHAEEEYTDENGVTWRRVYDSTTTTDAEAGTTETTETIVTTVTEETSEAAAEETTTQEETMTAAIAAPQAATVPQTLMAGKAVQPSTDENTIFEVAHAMAAYFRTRDRSHIDGLASKSQKAGELMFAALNDVKTTGVGAAIMQPQWVSDVWGTRTYERKYVPLFGQAALTALKVEGFRFTTDAAGGDWTGDKSAVPSNNPATEQVTVTASRWAGGHDIAREFRDFDTPEFWTAYFTQMGNSYSKWSDLKCITAAIAGSTAVVAGAVPAGVNPATVLLVDGALSIVAQDLTPSFAVTAPDVYRSLLLQSKDDIIATLSLSLGLETGDLAGFRIIPSDQVAAGKVLVGSRDAATFYELPGAPIRTEALDMVKGGIDTGFFGYAATLINQPTALSLVTAAA